MFISLDDEGGVLSQAVLDDLVLHVDGYGRPMNFEIATFLPEQGNTYYWPRSLDWSGEDFVTLRLRPKPGPELFATAASGSGDSVTILFDQFLDPEPTDYTDTIEEALAEAFTVTADGVEVEITGIQATFFSTAFNLLLGSTIYQGQDVVVSYDQSAAGSSALAGTTDKKVVSFTTGLGGVPATLNNSTQERALPTVNIAAATGDITERGDVVFTVSRGMAASDRLDVTVAVDETGSMVASADKVSHTVTIAADQTSRNLTVGTLGDSDWEAHSTVSATISSDTDYTISSSAGSASKQVQDDDFPEATAALSLSSQTVDEGATVTATVTITTAREEMPHADGGGIRLSTADGTAAAGQDYASTSTTLSFGQGDFSQVTVGGATLYQASQTATIATTDDDGHEAAESFTVSIEKVTSGASATDAAITLGASSATVTISASDQPPLSNDATLSDGTLSPAFDADTLEYTASVPHANGQITVAPTKRDANATVEYLDADDNVLADADGSASGHQADLGVGANVIQVKVTAEDGATTRTYTVTVTRAAPIVNVAPSFTSPATFSVNENQTAVGTVMATDNDADDSVTGYELAGGDDRSLFSIGSASGALTFNGAPNFEVPGDSDGDRNYLVTVRAASGTGSRVLTAEQQITATVTDVSEQSAKPAAPTVSPSSGSTTSLDVSWTVPGMNGGPAITGYDLQYRRGPTGGWTGWSHSGTGTTTTITGLMESTPYQAQVRARNGESPSEWSKPGEGRTGSPGPNSPPEFPGSPRTFAIPENTAPGTGVGERVTATDANNDPLNYSLEGPDRDSFSIGMSSGRIRTKPGVDYNYEVRNTYSLTVKAEDGRGGSGTTGVTVHLTDVDEQPGRPFRPSVSENANSNRSLDVTWAEPDLNGGPPVTGYELQYREGVSGDWTGWPHSGTFPAATITDMTPSTEHQVRVRADNGELWSEWSNPGTGTTGEAPKARIRSFGYPKPGGDGWRAGDLVRVTAHFSLPVTVVSGTPQLMLSFRESATFGGGASKGYGLADYRHGSGSDTLHFEYTVTGSEADAKSVWVVSGSGFRANGAVLRTADEGAEVLTSYDRTQEYA